MRHKLNQAKLKLTLIEAAHSAGRILRKNFGKNLQVREKRDAGLVTNIDIAAEDAAIRILKRAFPEFGVLAEESGLESRDAPGRWIIDPLDGTTNYIHGFPMFCVSLAAEWQGELVAGVIYHPILEETYVAVRGKGAFLNRKRIHVSRTRNLKDALLTTGFTYRKDEYLHREMKPFERLSTIARAIRRPGSAALDMAYTARGVFDGFWEQGLSPWDVAAGIVLIEEAGGRVTDFKGQKVRIEKPELLASNPYLHEALRQVIAPELCVLERHSPPKI